MFDCEKCDGYGWVETEPFVIKECGCSYILLEKKFFLEHLYKTKKSLKKTETYVDQKELYITDVMYSPDEAVEAFKTAINYKELVNSDDGKYFVSLFIDNDYDGSVISCNVFLKQYESFDEFVKRYEREEKRIQSEKEKRYQKYLELQKEFGNS